MKQIKETPDMMYGALKADVDTSGLTLSKALYNFKRLLEDDRWQKVGTGFENINDFLETIDLSDFKFAIDQRKEVSKKLAELQASQRKTAKALGVGQATITRDLNNEPHGSLDDFNEFEEVDNEEVINEHEPHGSPPLKHLFENNIKREEKKKVFKDKIDAQKQEIINKPPTQLEGNYDVLVLDPPWNYGRDYDPESSRVANPYPEMKQQQLKDLKIQSNDNCVMWLWTTHAFMQDAFELINHWGFNYKAILTWNKENIGMGHWLRMQTEFCLLSVKGKPIWDNTTYRDIINEKRREHSRKPEAFYTMVNDICYGSKLEYFAREKRNGFATLGNDINKF